MQSGHVILMSALILVVTAANEGCRKPANTVTQRLNPQTGPISEIIIPNDMEVAIMPDTPAFEAKGVGRSLDYRQYIAASPFDRGVTAGSLPAHPREEILIGGQRFILHFGAGFTAVAPEHHVFLIGYGSWDREVVLAMLRSAKFRQVANSALEIEETKGG